MIFMDLNNLVSKHFKDYNLITPKNKNFGDITVVIKTKDVKKLGDLKKDLEKYKEIEKVEQKGLFLNIFYEPISRYYDSKKVKNNKKTVMIEYCQPNPNKELHVGHLRNAVLGLALSNLIERQNKVIRSTIYNDRGIHMCKSMVGYNHIKDKRDDSSFITECYVKYSQLEKENEKYTTEAQELLKKWEAKDKSVWELWQKIRDLALKSFNEIYKLFGVKFDFIFYESELYEKGKKYVLDLHKKGIVKKDDNGNYYFDLEKYKLPNKVVLRNDETAIYATTDVVLAKEKFEKYALDESIYVVSSDQELYFKQLFAILDLLGFEGVKKCRHMSYGLVMLPSGKMSSRDGTVVSLKDFYDDIYAEAYKQTKEKRSDLAQKEIAALAQKIALSGIKYYILKYDAKSSMIYDVKKSVSIEGESGPYLLYNYVRSKSIIEKSKIKPTKITEVYTEKEKEILRMLSEFNTKVDDCIKHLTTHFLAKYLYDLTSLLNAYYEETKIIDNDFKKMKNRISLLSEATTTIKNGLELLSIDVVNEI